MCRALGEAGAEVLLAATDADGPGELAVELEKETVYEGVATIFFRRQFSEAFKYSRPLKNWLDAHAGQFDVAHIHAVFSHSSLAAARACRRANVPYILRPLGSLAPWSLNHKRLRKEIFWRLGVKQMLAGAAAFHYTTRQEQELAEQAIGAGRGAVIPLGVEFAPNAGVTDEPFRQFAPELGAGRYVLVMSRLHSVKGLETLIEAFLATAQDDWKLVLAGAGETDYVNSLRRLVAEKNGAGRVLFAGWLEGELKESALRGASLLALTSFQENFGLCVVEALAVGVPVVLSAQVGVAPEVAAAGAGWVSAATVNDLAASLTEAMNSHSARREKGAAGLEFVKRYRWSSIAQELLALCHRLAAKKQTI
jgi:glycosyltransferase involved in cell wall biosynthesis